MMPPLEPWPPITALTACTVSTTLASPTGCAKLLVRAANRNLTINDGLITLVTTTLLVNINRIREVIPWFKSSYQFKTDDKKQTEIPVSRARTRRLRAMLKL